MPLPKFRFEVVGKSFARNVRGHEMRRVTLRAVPSKAFQSPEDAEIADLPEKDRAELPTSAPPDGEISVLVNAIFAKAFDIGDLFDLTPKEL
jgi:hypothetical protein